MRLYAGFGFVREKGEGPQLLKEGKVRQWLTEVPGAGRERSGIGVRAGNAGAAGGGAAFR